MSSTTGESSRMTEADGTRPPTPLQHDAEAPRPLIVGPNEPSGPYPVYLEGTVQRGFGRGSKELNCPTANLPDEAIAPYTRTLETGVHFGYARVDFSRNTEEQAHDKIYPMVMSVGWNPYYKNQKRTAEVHVLHEYPRDFYGQHLKACILGFVRPEFNYASLEALIEDIETDKKCAFASLERPAYQELTKAAFFTSQPNAPAMPSPVTT